MSGNASLPEYSVATVENAMSRLEMSHLDLFDIQQENLGIYRCLVTVTNPYDGKMWNATAYLKLYKHHEIFRMPNLEFFSKTDIAVLSTLGGLFALIFATMLLCWCCHFCTCHCNLPQKRNQPASSSQYTYELLKDDYSDLNIYENIGNGAFGAVFRGKYKYESCAAKLLTHHAQKVATGGLLDATAGIQTEALEAFRRECDFLESLSHTNIVKHFANLNEPKSDLPVLVMELMECNLKEFIKQKTELEKKFSLLCQLSLCLDISKGLEYLHSKGVIHRDLCDVNILLALIDEKCPKAKIADFGMSRILPYNYVSATLSGLAHRVAYLPSEARDDPYHYSHTLDIYSYGVIATQIVQMKVFFRKKSEVESSFDEISEVHFLKRTIHSCLSNDRNDRPPAADIVATILQHREALIG